MFTKRIGTGAPALLAALVLGATGLAGCASDEEPVAGESETYEPAGQGYDEDYYGGPFEKERAAGQGTESVEPGGEPYDSGPWGQQEAYGETGVHEGETSAGESETGVREGETGEGETGDRERTRNPFDRDY